MFDFYEFENSSKKSTKALQLIFGVGSSIARLMLKRFGVAPNAFISDLPLRKIQLIKAFLEQNYVLENKLRYVEEEAYRKLVANNSYRGIRLSKGLPVHGQRTKSNACSAKRLRLSLKYKI